MAPHTNALGQVVGIPVNDWQACPLPPRTPMNGYFCRLESLDIPNHAQVLFDAFSLDTDQANWTYLPYGPFYDFPAFQQWLIMQAQSDDPLFYAIVDQKTQCAVGLASYLRIQPKMGVIEVGHIHYSPLLQRTAMATEVMYLMMQRAFDELGYRRYEWKCNDLNKASKQAALRLGFRFEGIFRQAAVVKGYNRDTAWYSMLDSEWPRLKEAFQRWLNPSNFDENGQQLTPLNTRSIML